MHRIQTRQKGNTSYTPKARTPTIAHNLPIVLYYIADMDIVHKVDDTTFKYVKYQPTRDAKWDIR